MAETGRQCQGIAGVRRFIAAFRGTVCGSAIVKRRLRGRRTVTTQKAAMNRRTPKDILQTTPSRNPFYGLTTFCGLPARKARTFATAMSSSRCAGGAGGPGDVRRDAAVLGRQQRVVGRRRLGREHVEPGPGDPARIQRLGQRRLVDQRPAAGVDQIGRTASSSPAARH